MSAAIEAAAEAVILATLRQLEGHPAVFQACDGCSPWLQGLLNLEIRRQDTARQPKLPDMPAKNKSKIACDVAKRDIH